MYTKFKQINFVEHQILELVWWEKLMESSSVNSIVECDIKPYKTNQPSITLLTDSSQIRWGRG